MYQLRSGEKSTTYQQDDFLANKDDLIDCNSQRSQEFFLSIISDFGLTGKPDIEFPERFRRFKLTHFPKDSGKKPIRE